MSDYGQHGGGPPGPEQPMRAIPFDQSELSNLATMATLMIVAGVITILSGLLGIVASVVGVALGPSLEGGQAVGNLCGAVFVLLVYAALGVWLIVGGKAFQSVVRTDDADQANLATGLRQLRNVFLLKSVLIVVGILAFCVLFTLGMVIGGGQGPGY